MAGPCNGHTKTALIHLIKDTLFGVAPEPPIGRSSKSTPQHNTKANPKQNWLLVCFFAGPCQGHTTTVLIHLIKDTFVGVAPRPPLGISSKSPPQHNTKASPKQNWLLACFLAGPCHGHTKTVFIHLIKETFLGVAPRPPIGRSSNSTPQHNKKAGPMPNCSSRSR